MWLGILCHLREKRGKWIIRHISPENLFKKPMKIKNLEIGRTGDLLLALVNCISATCAALIPKVKKLLAVISFSNMCNITPCCFRLLHGFWCSINAGGHNAVESFYWLLAWALDQWWKWEWEQCKSECIIYCTMYMRYTLDIIFE